VVEQEHHTAVALLRQAQDRVKQIEGRSRTLKKELQRLEVCFTFFKASSF